VVASTTLCTTVFLVMYFIPRPIMSVFTTDPALLATGDHAAKLIFLSMPIVGSVMVGTVVFQAIGKAVQSFIAAIVRPVIFLIPLALVLSSTWQLNGVFLSFVASDVLTFLLIFVLLTPVIRHFQKLAITGGPEDKTGTMSPLSVPVETRVID
jgi:Na+-driven multidrug efflux pump